MSRRSIRVAAACAVTALAIGILLRTAGTRGSTRQAWPRRALAAAPAPPDRAAGPDTSRPRPSDGRSSREPRGGRERRLARAELTLEGYLQSARYPPESRPLSERPDLVRLHHVPARRLPLARADRALTRARVTLRQDRYFVAAGEAVTASIACDAGGARIPCEVLSAVARAADPDASIAADVTFADGGEEGDERAGDGVLTAAFRPAAQGFAGYGGAVRIQVELRAGSESGGASFDLEHTQAAPASFTGGAREALEDGSLALHVGIDVDEPGRYVIRARVDDAEGRPFAFLSFDDELGRGPGEVPLRLHGRLVRDHRAPAPFRLRDVEGFLLHEDASPDRATMRALEGLVYETKGYLASDFSDDEWDGEEKARRLTLLSREVERASR